MPKVHLPDGRVVNFPDSMTPDQITHELSALATPQKSNTGMSTADLQAANLKGRDDLPSAGGFLGNVASSGGKFVTDAVTGIPGILKLLAAAVDPTPLGTGRRAEALTHAPEVAKAAGQGLKQRYGGLDETLSTAYHDPVGMAADVSTVAGGAGLAAKAGNAPRMARVLSTIERTTNPMSAIGAVAEGVARPVARTVVKATLRPPAAVRADFGGSNGIADAVLNNRVYSEASAGRKLDRSVSQADKLLADAQAAGTPGVPAKDVAAALSGSPMESATRRQMLGVTGGPTGTIADRQARILNANTTKAVHGSPLTVVDIAAVPDSVDAAVRATNELGTTRAGMIPAAVFGGDNPAAVRAARQLGAQANLVPRRLLGESQFPASRLEFGGSVAPVAPHVREIPLVEAQALKREAQDLAYEARKANLALDAQADQSVARALRGGIEARVPEVGPINERSQQLLGAKLAFGAAEDRPNAMTNMLTALGGGAGFAGGGPAGAAALAALIKALNSPRAGAIGGIGIDALGAAANAPFTYRTALLGRLANGS